MAFFPRLLLAASVLWSYGVRAETSSETFRLSLAVPPMAWLNVPRTLPDATRLSLELSSDCPGAVSVCVKGPMHVDVGLVGNTSVMVNAAPVVGQEILVEGRRLGEFIAQGTPVANAPRIYFDIIFVVLDVDANGKTIEPIPSSNQGLVHLAQVIPTQEQWSHETDLRWGGRVGRIYVQPVFESAGDFVDVNLALPGTYAAEISLEVTPL